MPTYKITDPEGKVHSVTGEGSKEEALSYFQSQWKPSDNGGQTHAAPMPSQNENQPDAYSGFNTAEKVAKGAAIAGGIGAPIAAIVAGAPAIPVLGGLAGGMAAGAGADWLLKKTGITPALESGAEKLRSTQYQPEFGGDYGVPANFMIRLAQTATPTGIAASSLEALPMLASTYAGIKGGAAGEAIAPAVRNVLMGSPKIPKGEEGAALLNTIAEQFGLKKVPQAPMNTGEFRQGLGAGRSQLGAEKGAVEDFAFANAKQPENAPELVQKAIADSLKRQGVPQGKPELASSPSAASSLQATAENVAPKVQSLEELAALQRQMAQKGASARKPTSPVSDEAPYYEGAAQNLKGSIGELLPSGLKEPLAKANKDFGAFVDLQKMGRKASRGGEFSPERMVAEWKTMEPALKAKRFDPETIKAIDQILEQGGPGVLGRLVEAGRQAANTNFGSAAKALLPGTKMPTRFNAPQSRLNPTMVKRLGATSGLAAAMLNN